MSDARASTASKANERVRLHIEVRGVVQGVGFRPFIYREASALGLGGWVSNTGDGVRIEAEGAPARLELLKRAIRTKPPPHARIDALETSPMDCQGVHAFHIRESIMSARHSAEILPDIATCDACLAELFDPNDRRHLYPFINCTACGPRYSIIEDTPYDRARTTMRHFEMCAECRAEYDNPASRRFHAEPIACPRCGPRLALWDRRGSELAQAHDALTLATAMISEGGIVAVKGIGGFHLVADARNEDAVQRLRARKLRPEKPFAVMFASLAAIQSCCDVSPAEASLLTGPERPIVLLRRRGGVIAGAVAPGNPHLGALLPYSPLHHLLLRELVFPIVATSGNLSDEPIVIDERHALTRLAGIADAFLVHDRPILRAIDDSVARLVAGRVTLLRCARGYAPTPIAASDVDRACSPLAGI